MKKGKVYLLISPHCEAVKIGRTEHPIAKRLVEINCSQYYGPVGSWTLANCIEVIDSVLVEKQLHAKFQSKKFRGLEGTNELFLVSAKDVIVELESVAPSLRVGFAQSDLLFKDVLLSTMEKAGLFGSLDQQGAWTLTLYPSTSGGRLFTLNVGRHEVAFATRPKKKETMSVFAIVCDRLITDYEMVGEWLSKNQGEVCKADYGSASERAVLVFWEGELVDACKFLELEGVKTAIIAYWQDRLSDMRLRGSKSFFGRFHNHEAVNRLVNYRRDRIVTKGTNSSHADFPLSRE